MQIEQLFWIAVGLGAASAALAFAAADADTLAADAENPSTKS